MSTSTYNPRDRSPIAAPEHKVCVTCGQPLAPIVKPITNHMNVYVNDISGHEIVMNNHAEYVEVQGVKLRRSDVPKTPAARVESSVASTPGTPAAKNTITGTVAPIAAPK